MAVAPNAAIRVRDLLGRNAAAGFTGRRKQLDTLLACLGEGGPVMQFVHGSAGIGKSALLHAFAAEASTRGARVLTIDGRMVEPTAGGFLSELGRTVGREVTTAEEAAGALAESREATVLVVDAYELLRLLDTWMRQVFVPALDARTRVILASRHAPAAPWTASPEWQGLARVIQLGPLDSREALDMLGHAGLDRAHAERVNRLAQGHPLALRLAAAARLQNPDGRLELAAEAVVHQLTRLYLADVDDEQTRSAIEAASTVRRVTISMLAAMFPAGNAQALYDQLSSTSFLQPTREGLMLQASVQEAISGSLRASDPQRWAAYRHSAWRQLQAEARTCGPGERWRYTADMLYMVENPYVREAFFPSGSQDLVVEPAVASDGASICAISERHEGTSANAGLRRLWEQCPESFHVLRDASESVVGFYVLLEMRQAELRGSDSDLLIRCWRKHLREEPVGRDETAVFVRRWLSADSGEAPSAAQAACWLDVKRAYMELRPRLRRCYLTVCDLETYGPIAQQLGFKIAGRVDLDGAGYHVAVLDFGPESVDGWLRAMVARELGMRRSELLDADARELVLDGRRIVLTELEFSLLRALMDSEGKTLGRAELLKRVWGRTHSSGSNVVDVVVRSLRKKMGASASLVETVRGVGYRFRA